MQMIIQIEGREAIPVRALPWATDWWFGADDVSDALGQEEGFECFAQVRAWRIEGSTPVLLLPRSWQDATIRIEEIQAKNLDRHSWKEQATAALRAGTFVWLDEWLDAYNQHLDGPGPKEAMAALLDADGDHEGAEALRQDAEEARFCREPSAAEHMRGTIMEGFEAAASVNSLADMNKPTMASIGPDGPDDRRPGTAALVTIAPDATTAWPMSTQDRTERISKVDLIRRHRSQWRSIESDLDEGHRNGLAEAARCKDGKRGIYFEQLALEWARLNARLETGMTAPSSGQALQGLVHRLAGGR